MNFKVMYKLSNRAIVNVKHFVSIFVNFVLFSEYCIMFDVFANCEFFNCRKKIKNSLRNLSELHKVAT